MRALQGSLSWPVLFLYPEHGETDFVEEFVEGDAFADHLRAMFGPGKTGDIQ